MRNILSMMLISIFVFISLPSNGQDTESRFTEKGSLKDWGFSITPYGLLASQATDVGGEKLRQSFNDIYSITNGGFQLAISGRYKRFLFLVDGTYAKLISNNVDGNLKVDLQIVQNILDLKAGYIVYDDFTFEEEDVIRGWALELNGGAKYWSNDVTINYSLDFEIIDPITGDLNKKSAYWDAMFGIKTRFILSKKVFLGVAFSYGGFGWGKSSKYSYDFTYLNAFKVSDLITINAGYRSFKYDRVDGTGEEQVSTTVSVFGPLIGVSFVL